jgi:superoxide dismutase, Cu-Zn family
MKRRIIYIALFVPLTYLSGQAQTNQKQIKTKANTAEAHFIDVTGKSVGSAVIAEQPNGHLQFHFTLNNLPPGSYRIQIHEKGECAKPDFKSAGKHFDPGGEEDGAKNSRGLRAGNLGNIKVGTDRKADIEVTSSKLSLETTDRALIRPGGTAIVIHASQDDQKKDLSGDSGVPIACGVIEKAPFTHPAIHTVR